MELNRKILKYGLILIILSVVASGIFSWALRIEEPVFMKMYIEKSGIYESDSHAWEDIELRYITNLSDRRNIVDVRFNSEPNIYVDILNEADKWNILNFQSYKQDMYDVERAGRYYIHSVRLRLYLDDLGDQWEEIDLSTASIRFNDGTNMLVDLGKILICNDQVEQKSIKFNGTSHSLDGSGSLSGKVKEDIKLLYVKEDILSDDQTLYKLYINNKEQGDIEGTDYRSGEALTVKTQFDMPMSTIDYYTYFEVVPKLFYEDKQGNRNYIRLHNISHEPWDFGFIEIIKYLRARGEI